MTHAPGHIVRPRTPGSSVGLPKGIFAALRRQPPPIRVASILLESASLTSDVVYQRLRSRATGLTTDEAEARLSEHGPNMVAADGRKCLASGESSPRASRAHRKACGSPSWRVSHLVLSMHAAPLGQVYLRKGDLKLAIHFLERAHETCDAWNVRRPPIATYLGYAYLLSGRDADGLKLLERGTAMGASMGAGSGHAYYLAHLSEAYQLADRFEDAVRCAKQALDFARDHDQPPQLAWALWALAETDSHRDPPAADDAKDSYQQAVALADKLGMRPLSAHCHLGLGKLHRRTGKRQETREHLVTAAAMYRAMDMQFWLEKIDAESNSP